MRTALALALLALATACASDLESEYRPQSGVVTALEELDLDRIEGKSGVRTSISIGIGSGGSRSAGIGIGFPLGGDDRRRKVVRYEIDLVGEGPIVVYHPRRQFAIDDCVLVRIHPDAERHPPRIRGLSDDCDL